MIEISATTTSNSISVKPRTHVFMMGGYFQQKATSPLCTANGPISDIRQCAVVVATVNGGPADPKCGTTLSMDTIGNKLADSGDVAFCWK